MFKAFVIQGLPLLALTFSSFFCLSVFSVKTILRAALGSQQVERKVQRFPICPLSPTQAQLPPLSMATTRWCVCHSRGTCSGHAITHSLQGTSPPTLGVGHAVGLDSVRRHGDRAVPLPWNPLWAAPSHSCQGRLAFSYF